MNLSNRFRGLIDRIVPLSIVEIEAWVTGGAKDSRLGIQRFSERPLHSVPHGITSPRHSEDAYTNNHRLIQARWAFSPRAGLAWPWDCKASIDLT